MSKTPRTDAAIRNKWFPDGYENFARQLERELNEAWKWKDEDPRMLREQIRVADSAYQRLHEENKRLHEENKLLRESMAQI